MSGGLDESKLSAPRWLPAAEKMDRWLSPAQKMEKMDSPGRRDYDHQEEKRRIQAGSGRQGAARRRQARRPKKKWRLEPAPLRRRANQQVDCGDRQSETHLRAAHGRPLQYRGNRSDAEAASGEARSDRRDTDAYPQGSRTDKADHR